MVKLSLLGGSPVRKETIPWTNTMGQEELDAVIGVMQSGDLSAFIGRAGEGFLGGKKVKEIEKAFAEKFHSKFGISVNSATTALHTAIAACEIGPGDEVLVSPYTMSATASAILMNNAIPVFVDICEKTFNMNPLEIEKWITPRTKAIIVTNVFGLPANLPEIKRIAKKHNIYLIDDNAQAPGATINDEFSGAFSDLSIYSLNYHKIIHSGEGGVILTNNEELAFRCQLMRNHGEVVLDDMYNNEIIALGSNYRMTELHAAIGIEQLKKLDHFLKLRHKLADKISDGLKQFSGLEGVHVPEGYSHSYYVYPIKFNKEIWGITRETFGEAMKYEGFPIGIGYQKPLYLLSLYRNKKVYNRSSIPFSLIKNPVQKYKKGLCPIVERMYENELVTADICRLPFTEEDISDFLDTIKKVWNNRELLVKYEEENSIYNS